LVERRGLESLVQGIPVLLAVFEGAIEDVLPYGICNIYPPLSAHANVTAGTDEANDVAAYRHHLSRGIARTDFKTVDLVGSQFRFLELEVETSSTLSGSDDADWRRLRERGAAFVERMEAAGLDNLVNEDLRGGLGSGPFLTVRVLFRRGIASAHARLVAKLQEFMAGDRFATGNEAVPPEYKDLVDQYLRALSAGSTK
jgi:hypothetical protein